MVIQIKSDKFFLLFTLIVMLLSCEKNESKSASGVPLVIESVGVAPTKVLVSTESFPTELECGIGLFLKEYSCSNIEYYKAAGSNEWAFKTPIMLSEQTGTLYGYYPYEPSVTDIEDIPVRSSINGKDYMYVKPISGISSYNSKISLSLSHALALISVTFVKDASYTGNCELTYLELDGNGFSAAGQLNAKNGTLSSTPANLLFTGFSHTILQEGTTEPVLAIPSVISDARQDVDLKCIIDKIEYNVALHGQGNDGKGVIIKQGVHSNIKLTLKDKNLTISSVSVEPWNSYAGSSSETGLNGSGIYSIAVEDGIPGGEINM